MLSQCLLAFSSHPSVLAFLFCFVLLYVILSEGTVLGPRQIDNIGREYLSRNIFPDVPDKLSVVFCF